MAIRGALAGAKATKEGWVRFDPGGPMEAVPVLPATLIPPSCTAVPVPSSTTLVIIWVTAWAVEGFITREYTDGATVLTVTPSELTTREVRCGTIRRPPLATALATMAICSGVTDTPPSPIPIRPMSSCELPGGRGWPVEDTTSLARISSGG